MKMSTKLNYLNPENIIEKFMLSKKNKCKCGKTKDSMVIVMAHTPLNKINFYCCRKD